MSRFCISCETQFSCPLILFLRFYRVYAEFIERRLKNVGLSVDLLFPNEEVPLGRVLANIASRGTLYALVVNQLSEEYKSVTVNILYGQTQGQYLHQLRDATRGFSCTHHFEGPHIQARLTPHFLRQRFYQSYWDNLRIFFQLLHFFIQNFRNFCSNFS